ncbi:hypothetical protein SAMN05444920_102107 [Nonomuraea solani]|uniref:Uncharacterized protein n=1 Tax=Nonomuraea solani TaxID=1144553 RepID=A0A1H5Y2C9_9ACTN|nr:hypothetical protein [Nonomuraea solani]SEG18002.1 hypothetical protein SAMN05444920_102107 [Nonomuraea solani]
MNPWQEVLDRIEEGDDEGLAAFLDDLGDLGRRAVATRLPGHMTEELLGGFMARQEIEDLAPGFRMAGAACFPEARQVAAWLNRRELRAPRDPEDDTERILTLLRRRPLEWRRDLAARLVERLRPPTGGRRRWRRVEGVPGWDLAAALVSSTGLEPPDDDTFVIGWVWQVALRARWGGRGFDGDPLLETLLPRLFQAPGVTVPLSASLIHELAALAGQGRVPRRTLIDGCAGRFLTAGPEEVSPFVTLWRALRPEPEEIPVLDFVRLLPAATLPLAELAVEELRRAEAAGLLNTELFAEAVSALAYRAEKKLLPATVQTSARHPAGWPRMFRHRDSPAGPAWLTHVPAMRGWC